MDTIAFLIADELMQQSVYTILHIYKDKLEAHDITTTITIIDFPHLIDQARGLIRQGAKVIITNSGSHQILTKAIDNVPILCLFSSTNDALYTLRSIAPKYKQIHLLLNENFMFNKDACPEELRKKIVFYPRYSLDKTHLELLARVRQLPVTPDTAIVGCPLLPQIAYPSPMPIYSIRPSESTMLSVLLYAQELLVFQRKDNKQLSMMSSILSHVTDGIILYAKGGAISHINERAASFLGIPVTTKNMRDIFPDWTEGSSPSFHETILQRPPYTLIANSDFFLMDSRSQYILTIRDVTELQRLEKNIRYKLSKTGLTAPFRGHQDRRRRHEARHPPGRSHGPVQRAHPHPGRERHGEGTLCPEHPQCQRPPSRSFRGHQLRRPADRPPGKRALRLCRRVLYGRPQRRQGRPL